MTDVSRTLTIADVPHESQACPASGMPCIPRDSHVRNSNKSDCGCRCCIRDGFQFPPPKTGKSVTSGDAFAHVKQARTFLAIPRGPISFVPVRPAHDDNDVIGITINTRNGDNDLVLVVDVPVAKQKLAYGAGYLRT